MRETKEGDMIPGTWNDLNIYPALLFRFIEEGRVLPDSEKPQKAPENNYRLFDSYQQQWKEERRDLLKFVPFAVVQTFSRNGNEGLYGWTIRGSGIIHQRDDLEFLDYKIQNAIHESIHTTDEYETRCLTEWIMQSMMPEKEKYGKKVQEYRQ